jgi:predicted DNA-binding helix-hairpin-helix protein
MCYTYIMSDIERLQLLTKQMHLEPAEDCHLDPLPPGGREAITVKNAIMPNGQRIKLLKTLLSSYCEKNCLYCPFRAQRDMPRAAFTPDDFAHLFDSLYRSGFVEGIFLSSSVYNGAINTQDKLLDTATISREKYQFKGYLHLKIMPGAEKAQVERAMLIADRLSVNLEAPHSKALAVLAPQKDLATDLLAPLKWIQEIRSKKSPSRAWKGKWPSSTTQFVVGAAGETDLDILSTTAFLHKNSGISRAYYSSFNPIQGTPLENMAPSHPRREFRLYQAFFLLRDYGFTIEDLNYQNSGYLPLEKDPKSAWADQHLLHQPLEINHAPREQLLRVPGLGPKRVENILSLRRKECLKSYTKLKKLRLITEKTAPYILLNGKSPDRQLCLF